MNQFRNAAVVSLFLAVLFGCQSSGRIREEPTGPQFDPKSFFSGKLRGEGVLYGPLGRRWEEFEMDLSGRSQGASQAISFEIRFRDGKQSAIAEYQVSEGAGPEDFLVQGDEIIGVGTGERFGSRIVWKYRFRPRARLAGRVQLQATDLMVLRDPETLVNVVYLRKFGIPVGQVRQVIVKLPKH